MTRTTVDLRALKAARREATNGTIDVLYGDDSFVVATEVPLAVLSHLRQGDIEGAARALFGADQAERFLSIDGVSIQDFNAVVEAVTGQTTGAPLGEPSGSSAS